MKIEIIEQKGNTLKFKLSQSSPAFANALRRLMSEVPVLAIDEVIIIENSSPLYDEILAHRLGLLPLTTPDNTYVLRSECTCEGHGCSNCEVSLTLDKEGQTVGGIDTVYSGDLDSENPDVKPVIQNIPILRFTHGQRVVIQAIARLGKAIDHAKFQCAIASYKYEPLVIIDPEKSSKCQSLVEKCPPQILVFENNRLKVTDSKKCILCNQCVDLSPEPGAIRIETTGKDFLFTITSLGQMSVYSLLSQSLKILKDKSTEMKAKIFELSIIQ